MALTVKDVLPRLEFVGGWRNINRIGVVGRIPPDLWDKVRVGDHVVVKAPVLVPYDLVLVVTVVDGCNVQCSSDNVLAGILQKNPEATILRGACGQAHSVLTARELHNAMAKSYNLIRNQLSEDLPPEIASHLLCAFLSLGQALRARLQNIEIDEALTRRKNDLDLHAILR